MKTGSQTIRLVLCAALATAASFAQQNAQSAAPQPPQKSQPAQEHLPTFKVTTRLVVVDVVATDRKGHPITDLKPEDFSLTEEGAAQKIRVFSLQQPEQAPETRQAQKLPPNMFSNIPSYKPNRALSVLLLDALNTDIVSQKYAREQMLKVLEKLPAGQPVAVYALAGRLLLLQDFTSDPTLLKEAISKSKQSASPVLEDPASPTGALSPAGTEALSELGLQGMVAQIQEFEREQVAAQTDLRVELTVTALKSLARTLSGYPGRKNLIWVSSAFPAGLFTDPSGMTASDTHAQEAALSSHSNYGNAIEQVSSLLANARVAVYPVDTRGVVGNSVYSSMSNSDSNGNYLGRTATGRVGGSSIEGRSAMGAQLDITPEGMESTHATMNTMAERTGGRAFYNTNYLDEAVLDGMKDGSVYYTLGYYPENKSWDGKFRRIVVKIARPGIKLHYRQGYFASDPKGYAHLDPRQQAIDLGEALNPEFPVSTALLFRSAVMPPSEKTGNKVMINYGVDAHALSFELQDDGLQHASVDCVAQAFSPKGSLVQTHGQTFAAALKPEQYQLVMQRFFPCSETLDLPAGTYRLRLAVRDNTTGVIGTANARVTVPASLPGAAGGAPAGGGKQ